MLDQLWTARGYPLQYYGTGWFGWLWQTNGDGACFSRAHQIAQAVKKVSSNSQTSRGHKARLNGP